MAEAGAKPDGGPAALPDAGPLKVFLSYSRRDLVFAERLAADLTTRGFDAYLDKKDILPGEPWQERLGALILAADTILFIISPDSIASEHCNWEANEAVRLSKRILPVVCRSVPDKAVPVPVKRLNYVFMRATDTYTAALDTLTYALKIDIPWVRKHTWLTEEASRWRSQTVGGDHALLRGPDLADAELWLSARPAETMEPTELQRAFITASREADTARLDKERRQIRRTRLFQRAVGVLLLIGTAGVIWQDIETDNRETTVFLNPVDQAVRESRYDRAMRYALQTLPARGAMPWAPVSPAMEGKLGGAALLNRQAYAARGHTGPIKGADISSDGARFVTASADGTARLWEMATGQEIAVLSGHAAAVWSAQFSPDGTRIVTASPDKTARIWGGTGGRPLAVLTGHGEAVKSAFFSRDGQRVVTAAGDNTIRIFETETGKEVQSLSLPADAYRTLYAAHFAPGGMRVVSAWSDGVRIWDLAAPAEPQYIKDQLVSVAALSPDGSRLLAATARQGSRLMDAATGREIMKLDTEGKAVACAAFSPDGKFAVTCSANAARIWDTATGKIVADLKGHTGNLQHAAFSPDSRLVVTASSGEEGFTIVRSSAPGEDDARVWLVATGEEIALLDGHTGPLQGAMFHPDSARVLTVSDDATARVWQTGIIAATGALAGHAKSVQDASFSPDGTRIVTASDDATVRLWDATSFKEITRLLGHTDASLEGGAKTAAFSPDGKRIVTAGADRTARIWDAATGASVAVLSGHEKAVVMAAYSPDGARIATAAKDDTVRLWNAATGQEIAVLKGHPGQSWAAFSPDGTRLLTAGSGTLAGAAGMARLWDGRTGQELGSLPIEVGGLQTITYSRDGRLVVAAYLGNTARVWDAASGALMATLKGHLGYVFSAAFTPDGARIVTASADGTARLWDTRSGEQLAVLAGHKGRLLRAEFDSDGGRVVTASTNAVALVWDVAWVTKIKGVALRDRVCSGMLVGVQEFTPAEIADPFLRGVDGRDSVGRNPCLRRGPLSLAYYGQAIGRMAAWISDAVTSMRPNDRP